MSARIRNVAFTLCGVAGLLLKGRYRGPLQELVLSYAENFTVSFAVYFIVSNLELCVERGRLFTAGCALAAVSLFEATDGFGVTANTYDPWDYAANAAGIALAVLVDAATARRQRR